jgi:hypothetical protein
MSIIETVLVFAGIPVLVFGVLAVLVMAPGAARAPRFRPGEAWEHPPVWYLPQPDRADAAEGVGRHAALPAGHAPAELTASTTGGASTAAGTASPARTAKGGVHDTW